ncbi:MAG: hypothetical protein L0I24_20910 [Pseudonocardia sp.]|nr:hypothetical protein [Pseudonocardia sp.]
MTPTTQAPPSGAAAGHGRTGMRAPSRALRSGVAAGTATVFGAAGHVLAGGTATVPVLVAAFAAAVLPAWVLSAREQSWIGIAALQVGTQQAVHMALSTAGPAAAGAGLVPHGLMFHVHVVAGLIVAAVLWLGERRLWTAARRWAGRMARWGRRLTTGGPARASHPPRVPNVMAAAVACARLLRHVRALRGPPATV